MQLILASQSPSRRAVLRAAGVEPVVRPANIDETALLASLTTASPADKVRALAKAKAQAVGSEPGSITVGCDSMLLIDGQLQGKPHTQEAAVERWRAQRGRQATLLTGHWLLWEGGSYGETTSTEIFFAPATDADIYAYAETGEPLECAGAFTLEALGGWFVERIEGDPSSVIGISLPLLRRVLNEHVGINISDLWQR
ncbi:Maf family protein [Corynebacterium caspium]|uniref:Maf family protein n=1 Tax=Corynebacterium caspium TaxID=234828 RepID=UPI0003828EB3|nr:nucleoside triphosphate pyrophosphatase [Corynebacterium caspium]WKD59740.1 Septum formation protein Maf [Corynebacterium caspium DSM 44850]